MEKLANEVLGVEYWIIIQYEWGYVKYWRYCMKL